MKFQHSSDLDAIVNDANEIIYSDMSGTFTPEEGDAMIDFMNHRGQPIDSNEMRELLEQDTAAYQHEIDAAKDASIAADRDTFRVYRTLDCRIVSVIDRGAPVDGRLLGRWTRAGEEWVEYEE